MIEVTKRMKAMDRRHEKAIRKVQRTVRRNRQEFTRPVRVISRQAHLHHPVYPIAEPEERSPQ